MALEIVQVLRGRSFRDTLFGKVRYGQAIMQVHGDTRRHEVPVVIKEYDRDLVERRMTRNGEQVGEDAKEELRIHSMLSQSTNSDTQSLPLTQAQPQSLPARSTGHPHIVHLYDVRKDDRSYYAILEYCSRGEFFPLVQHSDFTPHYARHYFKQLMLGLKFMHSLNIAHRDLSLENILLDEHGLLKICDFGVAINPNSPQSIHSLISDQGVPVGKVKFYMPPEVFARQLYSPALVDVWTSGIILFVMLTKVHPFKYATPSDPRFTMVYEGRANQLLLKWGKEPLHPIAEDLVRRMLCVREARFTIEECLNHPFCRDTPLIVQPSATGAASDDQMNPQQHHHYSVSRNSSHSSHSSQSSHSPSQSLYGVSQQHVVHAQPPSQSPQHTQQHHDHGHDHGHGNAAAAQPSYHKPALSHPLTVQPSYVQQLQPVVHPLSTHSSAAISHAQQSTVSPYLAYHTIHQPLPSSPVIDPLQHQHQQYMAQLARQTHSNR